VESFLFCVFLLLLNPRVFGSGPSCSCILSPIPGRIPNAAPFCLRFDFLTFCGDFLGFFLHLPTRLVFPPCLSQAVALSFRLRPSQLGRAMLSPPPPFPPLRFHGFYLLLFCIPPSQFFPCFCDGGVTTNNPFFVFLPPVATVFGRSWHRFFFFLLLRFSVLFLWRRRGGV